MVDLTEWLTDNGFPGLADAASEWQAEQHVSRSEARRFLLDGVEQAWGAVGDREDRPAYDEARRRIGAAFAPATH